MEKVALIKRISVESQKLDELAQQLKEAEKNRSVAEDRYYWERKDGSSRQDDMAECRKDRAIKKERSIRSTYDLQVKLVKSLKDQLSIGK